MSEQANQEIYGVLAEYKTPTELVEAARRVRDSGFAKWDTHTPFPVHGIDPAMGIKPTILPWIVLGAGLTGTATAILMQWWMNAHDYAFPISGKPFFSLPANIPIAFELTVLFAAFAAFFGQFILNMLPEWYNPLFDVPRFKRATSDRFFVFISAKDPKFSMARVEGVLADTNAEAVETVMHDPSPAGLPPAVFYGGIVVTALALVPLAYALRARTSTSELPRYHVVPNMDWQPKYKAQTENTFFADGRGARPYVENTVHADAVLGADHFQLGKGPDGTWVGSFPAEFEVSEATMERGEERYRIFCSPCHGLAGYGDGAVSQRAEKLGQATWVPPTSLHDARVREQPLGETFNSITNGIRNMPAYGDQIPIADRWAIILYVKALQRSQFAALEDVPPANRGALR